MKMLFILSCLFFLNACTSKISNKEHEQTFICKSMIQGYLNTQQLGQYSFHQKIHENKAEIYIYKQPTVSNMVLGMPQQRQLKFACSQPSENMFSLQLIAPFQFQEPVLSLRVVQKNLL